MRKPPSLDNPCSQHTSRSIPKTRSKKSTFPPSADPQGSNRLPGRGRVPAATVFSRPRADAQSGWVGNPSRTTRGRSSRTPVVIRCRNPPDRPSVSSTFRVWWSRENHGSTLEEPTKRYFPVKYVTASSNSDPQACGRTGL